MEKIKIIDVKSVGYEGDIEDWNPFGEFCHIDEYIIFALDDRDENNQAMYIWDTNHFRKVSSTYDSVDGGDLDLES